MNTIYIYIIKKKKKSEVIKAGGCAYCLNEQNDQELNLRGPDFEFKLNVGNLKLIKSFREKS